MSTRLPVRGALARPSALLVGAHARRRLSRPAVPSTAPHLHGHAQHQQQQRRGAATSSVHGWSTAPPRAKHRRFNQPNAGLPALTTGPAAALARRAATTPLRTGVLATKKGMTSVFVGKRRVPCTVLQLDQVQVLANKTRDKHGYWAVQVGAGSRPPRNVTRPLLGYYEAKGVAPKSELAEFHVRSHEGLLPVGVQLRPDWFQRGQFVDVRARSRGMGFAGGMKRHGFAGQEASHGNSKNHRTSGSLGGSQGSGSRVHPGTKMPGRMGNDWVTVQNLRVLHVDNDLGVVLVHGCVPGPTACTVRLQDAKKRKAPALPFRQRVFQELLDRHPGAAEALDLARKRHLEMKQLRQQPPHEA